MWYCSWLGDERGFLFLVNANVNMWEPSERVTTESSKNTRMIPRGFLLFLASMSASLGLECQDSRLGNCHCQNLSLRANLELFCPSFQPHKQKLHTLIEKFEKPEKDVELTCSNGVAWLDKWVSVMTAQQLVSEIFYSSKASQKLFSLLIYQYHHVLWAFENLWQQR